MSHVPQRKEKDCLNCGAMLQGRYCHVCGQENVVPKETFWHMVIHFFYDITHFDSSFFHTVHHLILRPGFLSKEYMLGRRASYLHPVRMYVFTSAIFFLLFFSLFKPAESINKNVNKPLSISERADYVKQLQQKLKTDTGNVFLKTQMLHAKDTSKVLTVKDLLQIEGNGGGVSLSFSAIKYKSAEEYDSIERTLPPSERDGWFIRRLTKKEIGIYNKYRENPGEALNKFGESVLHKLPYMLFISLPLFALLLKLVYIRRKQFYFADHGVFTIHLYIFTFILLMAVFALNKLRDLTRWDFIGLLIAALFIGLFFYLYKAMRNFYGQGRGKTVLKFLFVAFWSLIMMLILLIFFLFFSAVTL